MKNILIIGGSRFVGPHIVNYLSQCGHAITVFNRGRIKTDYPTGVCFVKGDRNEEFGLKERFDVVIDMCAYYGFQTERAIRELKFDFFINFGTAAAYKKTETFPLMEELPLSDWPLWGDYNRGKVECEEILKKSGVKYATVRPTYILGQKNYIPRESFIYSRIKNGLPLILPGNGEALVQFAAAKDVAASFIMIAEKQLGGAFNCAGDEIITLKELVEAMATITGKKPIIQYNEYADGERFNGQEFPFANENFVCSNEKIKKAGMKFTPLIEFLKNDYENYYQKF